MIVLFDTLLVLQRHSGIHDERVFQALDHFIEVHLGATPTLYILRFRSLLPADNEYYVNYVRLPLPKKFPDPVARPGRGFLEGRKIVIAARANAPIPCWAT